MDGDMNMMDILLTIVLFVLAIFAFLYFTAFMGAIWHVINKNVEPIGASLLTGAIIFAALFVAWLDKIRLPI